MRLPKSLWYLVCSVGVLGLAAPASAQFIQINPPQIRIGPPAETPEVEIEQEAPPPQRLDRRRPEPPRRADARWEAVRAQMAEFREGCEEGNRRACVRLGIIIGENRERRAQWSREHPEMFTWERERR
jgi:hypothetical protein